MCVNPLLTIKSNGEVLSIKKVAEKIKETRMTQEDFYAMKKSQNIIEIKCGKCKECLKEKYMEWLNKLKKEMQKSPNNYMLNLTYDNEHIKELNKEDLQKFFKRLRKKYKVRYFYVGELGEKTERPHYHILMFDFKPEDLKLSNRTTKRNNIQFESKEIEKIWGKGLITLCKLEELEIKYVLKYLTKNKDKKEFLYGYSKKPPLGLNIEKIETNILKPSRTKSEKNYYKKHFGEIPKIESEEKDREIKIKEIERQTKLKYFDYIKHKRQN